MDPKGGMAVKKRGFSQETLKLIACVTMLIDHIGAVLLPGIGLRVVGRIAFPIYCFLIAEGSHYTRDPVKYAMRMGVGVLLSELPFDLALFGRWTWAHQSVMVTLLLGFLAIQAMETVKKPVWKLLMLPFAYAAEKLHTDYGGLGVVMIVMFALLRGKPLFWQALCLGLVCWRMNSLRIPVGPLWVPIELFAILAMVPIALYSGKKRSHSRGLQWGFYLFYPVHLSVLWLILMIKEVLM